MGGWTNSRRWKNSKLHLQRKLGFTPAIPYSKDATQPHSLEIYKKQQIYKITKNGLSLIAHGRYQAFAKNEKDLETLTQTIRIYNQVIRMEFANQNLKMCQKVVKKEAVEGVEQPNQEILKTLAEKENYERFGNSGSKHH